MNNMETVLREKGFYIVTTKGDSMFPMLTTGTRVLIKKPVFPLKKYDIPVYRKADRYIMHRIVRVTKKGYIICGDNRITLEKDISESDIVGVFSGIFRNGRLIGAEDEELLSFGKKAYRAYPIRWFKHTVKKVLRKLSIIK